MTKGRRPFPPFRSPHDEFLGAVLQIMAIPKASVMMEPMRSDLGFIGATTIEGTPPATPALLRRRLGLGRFVGLGKERGPGRRAPHQDCRSQAEGGFDECRLHKVSSEMGANRDRLSIRKNLLTLRLFNHLEQEGLVAAKIMPRERRRLSWKPSL